MSFFYNLNDKLNAIREKPEVTHKQLNERDMSRAAKGYEKYGKQGMEALAKAGREGKALDPVRKKFDKYDEGRDFGPGRAGPNKNQAGPTSGNALYGPSPDSANYKTPNLDKRRETTDPIDKEMDDLFYSFKKYPGDFTNAFDKDGQGQTKYVNRTAPGVINKIKDKLGYDMPDPAYGPRPDETQRLAKRYPKPANESGAPLRAPAKPKSTIDKQIDKLKSVVNRPTPVDQATSKIEKRPEPVPPGTRVTSKPKDNGMGTIKGGVWTADPPKRGEKGVPAPSGDPEGVKEAAGSIDYEKVLEAIAALYGDDMWDNDAMGDLAQDLEQAGPTDRELDFIIAKGKLPTRLKGIRFTNTDDVQFGHLDEKSSAPMTAKQKSFAALAPPANKITFADKIAGAKKEVDEMLGDVAAEAMRNALSPKQKKIDMNKNGKLDANDFAMLRKGAKPEMDEERSKGTAFDPDTPRASTPKVGSIERGHKHDIKHTATGRVVTRRTDDQGNSVGADDDSDADAAPRGRGRPKGTKNVSSRAKVFQRKSKLMTKEGEDDPAEKGEYDREGDMALDDIDTIESAANELQNIIDADDNLPEWVQSKINKAMDYLDTARDYMAAQGNDQEPIAEKAVSKQQQKFMGMAHAMQKGEKIKGASKELKKVAKTMKSKDVEDFAKTKHKGLPDKVKKKEVDENSDDGRLVTKQSEPGKTSTSSSTGRISATVDKGKVTVKPAKSGGISYGQGIYDSMNRELENMIAESMSVNMSDSTEGNRSLTVTATDEDAMKLAMILKSAGLGGHGDDMHSHGEEPCDTCGMQDCGCGDVQEAVDENAPDWPTNTEQADNNFGYSGGLNKPKTDVAGDGQTTIPNTAVHTQDEDALRRMMEMAGVKQAELEPWKETMKEEEEEEVEEDFLESIQRMRAIAGIQEAKKPDFLDMDKDGDKEEPMSKAVKDKEEKKVDESIFALTNQWKAYKG